MSFTDAQKCERTARELYDLGKFTKAVIAYEMALAEWNKCPYSPEIYKCRQLCSQHLEDSKRKAQGARMASCSPPPPSAGRGSPPPLPQGWALQFDAIQRPYYVNTFTCQSQYEYPVAAAQLAIPPPIPPPGVARPTCWPSAAVPPPSSSPPPFYVDHPGAAPPFLGQAVPYGYQQPSAPPMEAAPSPPDDLTDQTFYCALFMDPVVAQDGFTYERSSIEAHWLRIVLLGVAPYFRCRMFDVTMSAAQQLIPNHDKKAQSRTPVTALD